MKKSRIVEKGRELNSVFIELELTKEEIKNIQNAIDTAKKEEK